MQAGGGTRGGRGTGRREGGREVIERWREVST